jgi:hypothetical protein
MKWYLCNTKNTSHVRLSILVMIVLVGVVSLPADIVEGCLHLPRSLNLFSPDENIGFGQLSTTSFLWWNLKASLLETWLKGAHWIVWHCSSVCCCPRLNFEQCIYVCPRLWIQNDAFLAFSGQAKSYHILNDSFRRSRVDGTSTRGVQRKMSFLVGRDATSLLVLSKDLCGDPAYHCML